MVGGSVVGVGGGGLVAEFVGRGLGGTGVVGPGSGVFVGGTSVVCLSG